MKILPLIISPDPLLKKISKPVEKVDDEIRDLAKKMIATMYAEKGIGLAAVQVGKLQRILVMDLDYERIDDIADDHISCCASEIKVKNSNPRILINPEIIEKSKETLIFKEGCLSFPGATADVTRPEMVTVKFLDENGKEKVEKMTDLLAICVQHEIDHLNGVTFVDYLSKLKREMILKKVQKSQK